MIPKSPIVALTGARSNARRVSELGSQLERQGLDVKTAFVNWTDPRDTEGRDQRQELVQSLCSIDVLYLLAAAGGVSVEMSLLAGIAHALGKPIYISEPTEDEAIDALAAGIVSPSSLCPAALGLESHR